MNQPDGEIHRVRCGTKELLSSWSWGPTMVAHGSILSGSPTWKLSEPPFWFVWGLHYLDRIDEIIATGD